MIFGLGLGYHLVAIRENHPELTLAVFEPRPEFLALYDEKHVDYPADAYVLKDGKQLNDFLNKEVVHGPYPTPSVFALPGYRDLFPQEVRQFKDTIRAARVRRAVNDKTLEEKGLTFLRHLTDNFKAVLSRPTLTDLAGEFVGRPGIILGSGPSLEQCPPLLNRFPDRGLILAAGSAVRPLIRAGVKPHVAVVLETEDTSHYLKGFEDPGIVLAAGSASHPRHFDLAGFMPTVYHLSPGAAYLFGNETFVPQAGTAGSAAFTLGLILGLDPLILIGHDQAFPQGKMHADGTPDDSSLTPDQTPFKVVGLDGKEIRTHSAFAASLHWFAESVQHLQTWSPKRTVINSGGCGAEIPGVPWVPLEDTLRNLTPVRLPSIPAEHLHRQPLPDPNVVRERLTETLELTGRLLHILRFSGEDGDRLIGEARRLHPFIKLALAGITAPTEPALIRQRLSTVEGMLLTMFGELT